LIVDALEIRAAGFLFIDALRQDEALASCPILIVASGSFPDEDRFTASARARGLHVMLEAVSFEDLCEKVGVIVDQQTFARAAVATQPPGPAAPPPRRRPPRSGDGGDRARQPVFCSPIALDRGFFLLYH